MTVDSIDPDNDPVETIPRYNHELPAPVFQRLDSTGYIKIFISQQLRRELVLPMATNALSVENVADVKWGSLVLLGVLAVIFGLLVVLFPTISATVLVELIGILIILVSFAALVLSALSPGGWKSSVLLALLAIIGFFFGIATIIHPIIMGQVIFLIAGIALFLGGLIGLVLAAGETHMTHRGLFALQGVLSIIIGLMICIFPLLGVALMVLWVGVILVIYGIVGIALGYCIRSLPAA